MKKNAVVLLILGTMLVGHSQTYTDVTKTHLPYKDLQLLSMDAGIADLDLDGDPDILIANEHRPNMCLLYTSPSPRDRQKSRMPSSA